MSTLSVHDQVKLFHLNVRMLRQAVATLRDHLRDRQDLTPESKKAQRALELQARVWQASVLLTSTYLPAIHAAPHRDILRLCKNLRIR